MRKSTKKLAALKEEWDSIEAEVELRKRVLAKRQRDVQAAERELCYWQARLEGLYTTIVTLKDQQYLAWVDEMIRQEDESDG